MDADREDNLFRDEMEQTRKTMRKALGGLRSTNARNANPLGK